MTTATIQEPQPNKNGAHRRPHGAVSVEVSLAPGVKCGRCWRMVPWHVPGVDLCERCRDAGIDDGWLVYDPVEATFSRNMEWRRER